jgi:hypothetical protein
MSGIHYSRSKKEATPPAQTFSMQNRRNLKLISKLRSQITSSLQAGHTCIASVHVKSSIHHDICNQVTTNMNYMSQQKIAGF